MDELIRTVSERAGLSESQARQAVEVVIDQLKTRLPEPIASQVDNYLTGEGKGMDAEAMTKGLGNILR